MTVVASSGREEAIQFFGAEASWDCFLLNKKAGISAGLDELNISRRSGRRSGSCREW
jgi:hypothetical protein